NGGQERQVDFNGTELALVAGPHGAACAVQQGADVGDAAFAQLLVLTHAAGKNALHRPRMLGVLGRPCKQVVQAGARPELAVEVVGEFLNLFERHNFPENCGPTGDGYANQQRHHKLDDPACVENETDNGKVL